MTNSASDNISSLITENIDIWTSAIKQKSAVGRGSSKKFSLHGIKKLRELILELAVRGKLVPQDPNDEPASILLERIAKEKMQLLKEGKLKKQKTFLKITEDEKPFKLPDGWKWSRLGAVGNIFNGNSVNARLKEAKYTNVEGLPFIATKDVQYGFESLDYENGIKIPVGEPKFKIAHKGSVLICAEGGSAGKKCGITDRDICFGNKLFANELSEGIHSRFILSIYLAPFFFHSFKKSMTGIIGGISTTKFFELLIPIPSSEEQERIIVKVDELMALCDQLEQETESSIDAHKTLVEVLLTTLTDSKNSVELNENWSCVSEHFDSLFTTEHSIDQLKQTILQLAVMGKLVPQDPNDEPASKLLERIAEEKALLIKDKKIKKQKALPPITDEEKPFVIPDGWEWVRFGFLFKSFSNGLYKPAKFYTNKGVISLRMYNIQNGEIDFNGIKRVEVEPNELTKFLLEPNDLLINRVNSKELVGKTAIVPETYEQLVYESMNIRAKPFANHLSPSFLNLFMMTRIAKYEISSFAKEAIGQASINQGQVSSIKTPLPPLEEQHRIVVKVFELRFLCDQLKSRLNETQHTQLNLADTIVGQSSDMDRNNG